MHRPCDAPPDAGSSDLGVQKYRPCDVSPVLDEQLARLCQPYPTPL